MNASRKECPSEDRVCGTHPGSQALWSLREEQQKRSGLCRDVCSPSIYYVTGMASIQHSLYRILFVFTTTLLSLYQGEDQTLERVSDLPTVTSECQSSSLSRVGKVCTWRESCTSGTDPVTEERLC